MGFPPVFRQAKRHVEKCSTKQKTKHNGWKNKDNKTRVQVLGASWIMMILMMNPNPSLLLAHPSNKAPEIIEFLKKSHPGVRRVWFFFRTLFAGFYHFTRFPKHFASLQASEPPHFSAPKKWQWLSKAQGGHQTVVGHGGSDGLWICGVATGHAPQVKGLEHFFVGKMDGKRTSCLSHKGWDKKSQKKKHTPVYL